MRIIGIVAIALAFLLLLPSSGSAECLSGERLSVTGGCIPFDAVDCGDGTNCPAGNFCGSANSCIPDGKVDCGDGSSCPAGNTCGSVNSCVPAGARDCGDGTSCRSGYVCKAGGGCLSRASNRVCAGGSHQCGVGMKCTASMSCIDDPTLVWRRVPSMASGNSCGELGGTSLSTRKQTYWRLVSQNPIVGPLIQKRGDTSALLCSCRWRAVYELTTTQCQRTIQETAIADGDQITRTRTIFEEIKHQQNVLANEVVNIGPGVAGSRECFCNPPDGGQIAGN
jgi:hypothetical protein